MYRSEHMSMLHEIARAVNRVKDMVDVYIDFIDENDIEDKVREIEYMHYNRSGGFYNIHDCNWTLDKVIGVVEMIEKTYDPKRHITYRKKKENKNG